MAKKFKNFIITDENGKPMAWSEEYQQLFYCTNFTNDEPFPVRAYTEFQAKRFMRLSEQTRKKNKMSTTVYKVLPFDWNRFPYQNRYER